MSLMFSWLFMGELVFEFQFWHVAVKKSGDDFVLVVDGDAGISNRDFTASMGLSSLLALQLMLV